MDVKSAFAALSTRKVSTHTEAKARIVSEGSFSGSGRGGRKRGYNSFRNANIQR